METQVSLNKIWFYMFLEHIFVIFCKVQGIVHSDKMKNLVLKRGFMIQMEFNVEKIHFLIY